MKKRKTTLVLALGLSVVLGITGCQTPKAKADNTVKSAEQNQTQNYKIGVAVYNLTDDEVNMFRSYYQNYLKNAFSVEFVYSSAIGSIEDEKEFVSQAKKAGCKGIISFVTYDLPAVVEACGDDLYYMMGSGTVSEADYQAVKGKKNFLGIIGPSLANEKEAGNHLIENLSKEDASKKTYVLLSGGAGKNNVMHQERLAGMLETLEAKGFTLEKTAEELEAADKNTLAATSADGGKVYVCPGYYYSEGSRELVKEILTTTTPDVVASVCAVNMLSELIADKEKEQNKNIEVGTIDCFSENNKYAFDQKDQFGNSSIDYLEGKCEAMSAGAFVAMYNAVSGHVESIRDNDEAFWLNQGFWHADSKEEYTTLYEAAANIYQNVYTCEELMKNITEYTKDANYQGFKDLVENLSEEETKSAK